MVSNKHGHRSVPTKGGSLFGGIVITAFGAFWTMMAANAFGIGGIFPLFGVIFIIAGIATSINAYSKAERYSSAERRYRRRRQDLEQRRSS